MVRNRQVYISINPCTELSKHSPLCGYPHSCPRRKNFPRLGLGCGLGLGLVLGLGGNFPRILTVTIVNKVAALLKKRLQHKSFLWILRNRFFTEHLQWLYFFIEILENTTKFRINQYEENLLLDFLLAKDIIQTVSEIFYIFIYVMINCNWIMEFFFDHLKSVHEKNKASMKKTKLSRKKNPIMLINKSSHQRCSV